MLDTSLPPMAVPNGCRMTGSWGGTENTTPSLDTGFQGFELLNSVLRQCNWMIVEDALPTTISALESALPYGGLAAVGPLTEC
jgi:hypothetical protein